MRRLHSRLIEIVLPFLTREAKPKRPENDEKGGQAKKGKKDVTGTKGDDDILKGSSKGGPTGVMGRNEDNVTRLQEYAQIKKYKLPTYKIDVIKTVFPNKVKVSCICPEITDKVCEVVADNKQKGKQESAGEMLKCINQVSNGVEKNDKILKNALHVEIINRDMIEKELIIEKEINKVNEDKIVSENITKVVKVVKNTQRGKGNNRWKK